MKKKKKKYITQQCGGLNYDFFAGVLLQINECNICVFDGIDSSIFYLYKT